MASPTIHAAAAPPPPGLASFVRAARRLLGLSCVIGTALAVDSLLARGYRLRLIRSWSPADAKDIIEGRRRRGEVGNATAGCWGWRLFVTQRLRDAHQTRQPPRVGGQLNDTSSQKEGEGSIAWWRHHWFVVRRAAPSTRHGVWRWLLPPAMVTYDIGLCVAVPGDDVVIAGGGRSCRSEEEEDADPPPCDSNETSARTTNNREENMVPNAGGGHPTAPLSSPPADDWAGGPQPEYEAPGGGGGLATVVEDDAMSGEGERFALSLQPPHHDDHALGPRRGWRAIDVGEVAAPETTAVPSDECAMLFADPPARPSGASHVERCMTHLSADVVSTACVVEVVLGEATYAEFSRYVASLR